MLRKSLTVAGEELVFGFGIKRLSQAGLRLGDLSRFANGFIDLVKSCIPFHVCFVFCTIVSVPFPAFDTSDVGDGSPKVLSVLVIAPLENGFTAMDELVGVFFFPNGHSDAKRLS